MAIVMLGKMIFDRRPHFVGHQISEGIFPSLLMIENEVTNNDNVRNREQLMPLCDVWMLHACLIHASYISP